MERKGGAAGRGDPAQERGSPDELPMAMGCCDDDETGMGDAARLSGELSRSG